MATVKKKKEKISVFSGNVYIKASFNNALSWASSGELSFRGAKKSTPFAAQSVCEAAAKKAMDYGLKEVNVYISGPGVGRESAVRSLGGLGLKVLSIRDVTPIPHNGCRPKKTRRV